MCQIVFEIISAGNGSPNAELGSKYYTLSFERDIQSNRYFKLFRSFSQNLSSYPRNLTSTEWQIDNEISNDLSKVSTNFK